MFWVIPTSLILSALWQADSFLTDHIPSCSYPSFSRWRKRSEITMSVDNRIDADAPTQEVRNGTLGDVL
jgi:predicted 2-oxoglutarate/Fe(II)-dependent dioxygenase YbiX